MSRLIFFAKLWGVLDELRAILAALQGARMYVDALASQLEAGETSQTPVTVTLNGTQLKGALKIVKAVQKLLDKVPHS